jgi:hypothetical protein
VSPRTKPLWFGALLTVVLLTGCGGAAAPPASASDRVAEPRPCEPACWEPRPTTEPWQWQLQGEVDLSVEAPVYDIGIDVARSVVDAVHAQGDRAICYLSVGTYEPYRADADRFPRRILGERLERFTNERWLDIRELSILRPIIADRLDRCAAKGFDAAEPDNVDAYRNRSGFPLSGADQLRYNAWVANAAHARGMAVGLKNDLDQVERLLDHFDFAVNEQCFQYRECGVLRSFVDAGKPVYGAEYEVPRSRFCERSLELGFSTIEKRYSLKAYRRTCG